MAIMLRETPVTELFRGIASYLDFYETPLPSRFTNEDIATIFDLAYWLENICKMINSDVEIAFNRKLSEWLTYYEFEASYDSLFLKESCDHILRIILLSDIPYEMKKEAKDRYVNTVSTPERSTAFMEVFINEARVEVYKIKQYKLMMNCFEQPKDRQAICLLILLLRYQEHKGKILQARLRDILTGLNMVMLETILRALTLRIGSKSQETRNVQKAVMTTILDILHNVNNQSLKSKFWKLCCSTDETVLAEVSITYPDFTKAAFNFMNASNESMEMQSNGDQNGRHFLSVAEIKALMVCLIFAPDSADGIKVVTSENSYRVQKENFWAELAKLLN